MVMMRTAGRANEGTLSAGAVAGGHPGVGSDPGCASGTPLGPPLRGEGCHSSHPCLSVPVTTGDLPTGAGRMAGSLQRRLGTSHSLLPPWGALLVMEK